MGNKVYITNMEKSEKIISTIYDLIILWHRYRDSNIMAAKHLEM